MKLSLLSLEPHESPVALDVVFGGVWATHPLRPLVAGVLAEMADRLSSLTPLAAIARPYTAFVDGTAVPGLPVAADELVVYVGDSPSAGTLGEAAPGGWSASGDPLPRSWGGWMDLDPTLDAVTLATVARHELGHVVGAGHVSDPAALLFPYVGFGQAKDLTAADAVELRRVGWAVQLPPPSPSGWQPFPGFAGEVHLAAADFNGDGVEDLVAAAGPGGGPHVKVRDGATGLEVAGFYAYDRHFAGGVSVAVGDVTGDGRPDLVTGAGPGGGPHVKVFAGGSMAEVQSYYATEPTFAGGVSVAVDNGHVVTIAGGVVR